jgi:hypothetical protein
MFFVLLYSPMLPSESEPVGENNPTPNAGRESDIEASNTEINIPPAPSVSSLPPAQNHCHITRKAEKNWWNKFKPFLQIAGVILLAVYTLYTIKMYCANKEAADAASKAANTARDAMTRVQRPWLGIDGLPTEIEPFTSGGGVLRLTVNNFGTAPALHVAVVMQTSISGPEELTKLANSTCDNAVKNTRPLSPGEEGSGQYIFPGNKIYPRLVGAVAGFDIGAGIGTDTEGAKKAATPTSHTPITTTPTAVTAFTLIGCIGYRDQFKVIHHTHFCFTSPPMVPCNTNEDAD